MAELKTKQNKRSVDTFVNGIADKSRRDDCLSVLRIMKQVTRAEPTMWGSSIVGFGSYRYKYESGREGEWFLAGFSPRKENLTLYIMAGFQRYPELMKKLGKYKTGKSCLYIRSLKDVNLAVLKELVRESVKHMSIKSP